VAEGCVLTDVRKVFFGGRKKAASITPDDALAQINISLHFWPYVVLEHTSHLAFSATSKVCR